MQNKLTTKIYSIFFGRKVGTDAFGNLYYVHKKNLKKRWVLYDKKVDPTAMSVDWHLWLNSNSMDIPKDSKTLFWQKKRLPNQTGTTNAYHPKREDATRKKLVKKDVTNKLWDPERSYEK